jgi:prevent-host-death family protein
MASGVVGARELKVRLGKYLRQVRQGRTLVITDRGQPVAELRPMSGVGGPDAILARLEADGIVTRPTKKRLQPFRRDPSLSVASGPCSVAAFDAVHKCAYTLRSDVVMADDVEWDPHKAAANLKKHGVDFADAALVLDDDQAITIREDEAGEQRYVTVEMDPAMRILVVMYTWRTTIGRA